MVYSASYLKGTYFFDYSGMIVRPLFILLMSLLG